MEVGVVSIEKKNILSLGEQERGNFGSHFEEGAREEDQSRTSCVCLPLDVRLQKRRDRTFDTHESSQNSDSDCEGVDDDDLQLA